MKKLSCILLFTIIAAVPGTGFGQTANIRVNQLGYYPDGAKIALVVDAEADSFEIISTASQEVVLSGKLGPVKTWSDAGVQVQTCNFSALQTPGEYCIHVQGFGTSYPLKITGTVLRNAARASLRSFYYQRCSSALEEEHAGAWARNAGHPDTACIFHPNTGKSGTLSSPGGWYDAGDYGKYVVNAGISVATLLAFHENFPGFFQDSSTLIPESGNGTSDLLDEVRYELDWLRTMQDEDGGVFHKLTTLWFIGFEMPGDAGQDRYVMPKSTAATLDFAAMMAMAGRIYADTDSAFAAGCVDQARQAWNWAKNHPEVYFENPSDVSTGTYGDGYVQDEFIWAAAELYITTGDGEYLNYLNARKSSLNYTRVPGWPNVQPLASLSLATMPNGLDASTKSSIRNSIVAKADDWIGEIQSSPARIPVFGYWWGSNSEIANIGVGLLYAYLLTDEDKYVRAAAECADYILGKNATGFSFQTGYGFKTPMNIHHRPSGSDGIRQPIPGFVAGGPNNNKEDGVYYPFPEPARSFADVEASYASNEICINWNSPLTFLLGGVDAVLGDSSEVPFMVPRTIQDPPVLSVQSPVNGKAYDDDVPFRVQGTATDPDGISRVECYLDGRWLTATESSEFDWIMDSLSLGTYMVTLLAYDSLGYTAETNNTFTLRHLGMAPGTYEAELFRNMSGITTSDFPGAGNGAYVTFAVPGNWIDLYLDVQETGKYLLDFQVSSAEASSFEVRKISQAVLASLAIEDTGGAGTWAEVTDTVDLGAGKQYLRIYATSGSWNLDWIRFTRIGNATSLESASRSGSHLSVAPHPVPGAFRVTYELEEGSPDEFILYNAAGQVVASHSVHAAQPSGSFQWNPGTLGSGSYILAAFLDGRMVAARTILKN